jgi:hypothetical protein
MSHGDMWHSATVLPMRLELRRTCRTESVDAGDGGSRFPSACFRTSRYGMPGRQPIKGSCPTDCCCAPTCTRNRHSGSRKRRPDCLLKADVQRSFITSLHYLPGRGISWDGDNCVIPSTRIRSLQSVRHKRQRPWLQGRAPWTPYSCEMPWRPQNDNCVGLSICP